MAQILAKADRASQYRRWFGLSDSTSPPNFLVQALMKRDAAPLDSPHSAAHDPKQSSH